jgi:hypothetical protein
VIGYKHSFEDTAKFSSATFVLKTKFKGSTSYTDAVLTQYPTYFHNVYCEPTKTLGDNTTFSKLAHHMNLQSVMQQNLLTLRLNKLKLWRWVKKIKGELKQQCNKPYLTDIQKTTMHCIHNNYAIKTSQQSNN